MSEVGQKNSPKAPGRPSHDRAKLLAAAREVFLEQGLDMGLDAIASKAGTTRQTLYNHFSSKSLLLTEVFESFQIDLQAPPLHHAMPHQSLAELLRQVGHATQQHVYSARVLQLQRLWVVASIQLPDILADLQQARTNNAQTQLASQLASQLAQAHSRGVIRVEDPDNAAKAFVGAAIGPMYASVLLGGQAPTATELAHLNQMAVQTFLRAWQSTE